MGNLFLKYELDHPHTNVREVWPSKRMNYCIIYFDGLIGKIIVTYPQLLSWIDFRISGIYDPVTGILDMKAQMPDRACFIEVLDNLNLHVVFLEALGKYGPFPNSSWILWNNITHGQKSGFNAYSTHVEAWQNSNLIY